LLARHANLWLDVGRVMRQWKLARLGSFRVHAVLHNGRRFV